MKFSEIDPETLEEAKKILASTPGTHPVILIGHPRVSHDDYPKDLTASKPRPGICSSCPTPIWSSDLKASVLVLAPERAKILCFTCISRLKKSLEDRNLNPNIIDHRK